MVLLDEGKAQTAAMELEQLPEASLPRWHGLALVYFALGRKADSDGAVRQLIVTHPRDGAAWIAEAQAYRNERDDAFKWIAAAYRDHTGYRLFATLRMSHSWDNIRSDPRYEEWLHKLNLVEKT